MFNIKCICCRLDRVNHCWCLRIVIRLIWLSMIGIFSYFWRLILRNWLITSIRMLKDFISSFRLWMSVFLMFIWNWIRIALIICQGWNCKMDCVIIIMIRVLIFGCCWLVGVILRILICINSLNCLRIWGWWKCNSIVWKIIIILCWICFIYFINKKLRTISNITICLILIILELSLNLSLLRLLQEKVLHKIKHNSYLKYLLKIILLWIINNSLKNFSNFQKNNHRKTNKAIRKYYYF